MREWIESLQERFDALEVKKRWIVVALPFLLVGLGAYFLYFEQVLQQIEQGETYLLELNEQITKQSSGRYEKMIASKKKEILAIKERIDRLKSKELALKAKLDGQRFIFLDGQNFARLLEDMLQSSVKNGLELSQIAIEDKEAAAVGKLKIKKSIRIEGVGEFLNIVKFVRSIEAHPVLMRVDRFVVETNGTTPSFKVAIDFYGVEG